MQMLNRALRIGAALLITASLAGCGDEDTAESQSSDLVAKPGVLELCAHTGCVDSPFEVPIAEALVVPPQVRAVPPGMEMPDTVSPDPERSAERCNDSSDRQNFCQACNLYSAQCLESCGMGPGEEAAPDPQAYQEGPAADCLRSREGACREAQLNCHACQTCERMAREQSELACGMSRALCQTDCDALGADGCSLCLARAAARCSN